jgi:RHS repeat-associated protein
LPRVAYDEHSDLIYNYYRDYDPQTGRYVQSDPIGLNGGVNTYAYAISNPLSGIDPAGLAVTWTGSVYSLGATVGIGGQVMRFKLESECKCNVKYKISGFASFLTVGAGAQLRGVGGFLADIAGSGSKATLVESSLIAQILTPQAGLRGRGA